MFQQNLSFYEKAKIAAFKKLSTLLEPAITESFRAQTFDLPIRLAFEITGGNQLHGDYFEFGVFKGRSFIFSHRLARRYFEAAAYTAMQFHAFDSFAGLPKSDDAYLPTQYGEGAYSAPEKEFLTNVKKSGVPEDKLRIHRGFFAETRNDHEKIKKLSERKISVAYIDCDIYEGAVDALSILTPSLQNGSAIVLDDWNRHHADERFGIRRAVAEWLAANPTIKLVHILTTKRALFVVNFENIAPPTS